MRQLLPFIALAALVAAAPALADEECPDGCGNPTPPSPPSKPTIYRTGSVDGLYRVFTANDDIVYGYVQNGTTGTSGGGAFHPIGPDGTVSDGSAQSNVTLKYTVAPDDATSQTSASAGFGLYAAATLSNSYLVELHARNAAAYAVLNQFLSTSGAIASIHGHYTLGTTGVGYAGAYVSTGAGGTSTGVDVDPSLQRSTGATCNGSGYYGPGDAASCTTTNYDLDLNFIAGSSFTNGDPLSVYSTIGLGTTVQGGAYGGQPGGTATAFLDPTITLNLPFNTPLYQLNVGSAITVPSGPTGSVPEPAAWALMVVGFGVVGGASRRQRTRSVAA